MKRAPEIIGAVVGKLPAIVSLACLVVVIFRTADFFIHGIIIDPWIAWTFAGIIEVAAVAAAYWFGRKPETRLVALSVILISVIASIAFNEGDVVRTLSKSDLVASDANFLGLTSEFIRWVYQWFGVAYGALPTLLATGTAMLQAIIDGVQLSPFAKGKKQSANWKKLPKEEKEKLRGKSPFEIRKLFPFLSSRTSQNWSKNAKKGKNRRK